MMDDETERAYAFAARTLADTRRIIDDAAASPSTILAAVARHGIAVWQLGQHERTWQWFCTLSYKAAWGDVVYTIVYAPTMDAAIRAAAREWSKTR